MNPVSVIMGFMAAMMYVILLIQHPDRMLALAPIILLLQAILYNQERR